MRIWEQLATGAKPYAAALAQLGYVAWQQGDAARAETLFMRSVETDKQLGSVSARLNLAQILRDKARRTSSAPRRRRATTGRRSTTCAPCWRSTATTCQAYASLCYLYFDREPPLYEMARLVGTQAIWRAEEIATGKYAGAARRPGRGRAQPVRPPTDGPRVGVAALPTTMPPARGRELAVRGTGYTPEMKKALGMVFNTMGLVSLKRKEVSDAIAHFRKAVDMDPELHEARMNLAALSLNYRDYATAEENFRAVLTAQPSNYDATIGLGVALRGNRKFDEAEQQYLAAQKLDPQNGDSYFNLGLLYQEYKGIDRQNLLKAQQYYRDFLGRGRSTAQAARRREAHQGHRRHHRRARGGGQAAEGGRGAPEEDGGAAEEDGGGAQEDAGAGEAQQAAQRYAAGGGS